MNELHEELRRLMQKSDELSYTDSRKSLELAEDLYVKAKSIQSYEFIYQALYLKGVCHNQLGEVEDAIITLSQAHHIALLHFPEDSKKHSAINNIMGIIYFLQFRIEIALDYYLQALEFNYESHKTIIYNNIALVYSRKEDFETSLRYTELALNAVGDKNAFATAGLLFNGISSSVRLKNITKAERKLEKLKKLVEKNADDSRFEQIKPQVSIAMALILSQKGKAGKALKYLKRTVKQLKSLNLDIYICFAYQQKAEIYFTNQEVNKAIAAAKKALDYAQKFQLYYEQRKVLESLIEHYKEEKDWKNALLYTEKLQLLADSSFASIRESDFKQVVSERENLLTREGETREQLQEQNILIEQFSHVISHDLKEPIRNIVSFSNLLKRRYGKEIGEEGEAFMESISKGANQMNQNLTRLLEFTSLRKTTTLNHTRNSLTDLIERLELVHSETVHPQQLIIDYPPNAFIIMEERHTINLWDELIGNAVKFRKPNKDCKIHVRFSILEHHYEYVVTDYGVGLDNKHKRDIFQMFTQIDNRVDGAGLGLAICERIVRLYGGQIYATSEINQFTSIHIQLPKKSTVL